MSARAHKFAFSMVSSSSNQFSFGPLCCYVRTMSVAMVAAGDAAAAAAAASNNGALQKVKVQPLESIEQTVLLMDFLSNPRPQVQNLISVRFYYPANKSCNQSESKR